MENVSFLGWVTALSWSVHICKYKWHVDCWSKWGLLAQMHILCALMVSLVAKIMAISVLLLLRQFWLSKEWEEFLQWNEHLLYAALFPSDLCWLTQQFHHYFPPTLSNSHGLVFLLAVPQSLLGPTVSSHSTGRKMDGYVPWLSSPGKVPHKRWSKVIATWKLATVFSRLETKAEKASPMPCSLMET